MRAELRQDLSNRFQDQAAWRLLFVFLVSNSQQYCRACRAAGARLLLNNKREAIKSGKGKKGRNTSPIFEILFMLVPVVGPILSGDYFLAWFCQDYKNGGRGAWNKFQHPRFQLPRIQWDWESLLNPVLPSSRCWSWALDCGSKKSDSMFFLPLRLVSRWAAGVFCFMVIQFSLQNEQDIITIHGL